MDDSSDRYRPTLERFSGFADEYDRVRPSPPDALAALLGQLTGVARAELVVDLGSGTGLSTRYWAVRADRVIGIEPSADMRSEAVRRTHSPNVAFREGYSNATGLPEHCARAVTCVQSLHWMEPVGTFREAARILIPGGALVSVDYDWPPVSGSWRADAAWKACEDIADRLEESLPGPRPPRWPKPSHRERMQASGWFRSTRELALHHVDEGTAERFIGLLLSQGGVQDLLKAGRSEAELGIDELRAIAGSELGARPRPWYWTARVRVGIT